MYYLLRLLIFLIKFFYSLNDYCFKNKFKDGICFDKCRRWVVEECCDMC